jgi:hypothetical protein
MLFLLLKGAYNLNIFHFFSERKLLYLEKGHKVRYLVRHVIQPNEHLAGRATYYFPCLKIENARSIPQISSKQRIAYLIPIPGAGSPVVKLKWKQRCAIIPAALLILTGISVLVPYFPRQPCLFSLFKNRKRAK